MTSVIQFLESMGANRSLAAMTSDDYEAAIVLLDADADTIMSLKRRDSSALTASLRGRPAMFCAVFAPDEKQPEESPSQGDDEKQPDQEPSSQ